MTKHQFLDIWIYPFIQIITIHIWKRANVWFRSRRQFHTLCWPSCSSPSSPFGFDFGSEAEDDDAERSVSAVLLANDICDLAGCTGMETKMIANPLEEENDETYRTCSSTNSCRASSTCPAPLARHFSCRQR